LFKEMSAADLSSGLALRPLDSPFRDPAARVFESEDINAPTRPGAAVPLAAAVIFFIVSPYVLLTTIDTISAFGLFPFTGVTTYSAGISLAFRVRTGEADFMF
jgi:hypothetical protein